MKEAIFQFTGAYCWLSNFWPCIIEHEGIIYPSVEHYYVAQKTNDIDTRNTIAVMESAGEVKRFGRSLNLVSDWHQIKLKVMERGLIQKFSDKNPELKKLLAETGTMLIEEGNNWGDEYWGVNLKTGVGQNNLGKLLMKIRHANRIGIVYE